MGDRGICTGLPALGWAGWFFVSNCSDRLSAIVAAAVVACTLLVVAIGVGPIAGTVDAGDSSGEIVVDNVTAPDEGEPAERVTVEATVKNPGDESATSTVSFEVGDERTGTTVNLDAGKSETLTLDVVLPDEAGGYSWSLTTADDTETGTLEIHIEDEPPEFVFEHSAGPDNAETGEDVTVEGTVYNEGGDGEQKITLWIDDEVHDSDTLELEHDERRTLTFDVEMPDDPDTVLWRLSMSGGSESGEITVVDPEDPPEFEISVSGPDEGDAGEDVTLSGTVRNVGGDADSQTVELVFDNEVVTTRSIALDSGESETIDFEVTLPETDGNYEWRIVADETSAPGKIEVVGEEPASLVIDDVDAPESGELAEELSLSVEVTNEGEETGESDLRFTLDGSTVETALLRLDGGDSETVTFDVTLPTDAGTYGWKLSVDEDDDAGDIDVQETDKEAKLSADNATVGANEQTTVSVDVTGTDVASYDVSLAFDSDVVNATTVDEVDFDETSVDIDNEAGAVDLSAAHDTGLDDPTLGQITFEAVAQSDAETEVTFSHGTTIFTAHSATFDVEEEPGTLTVEDNSQCEPGDVTGDGRLTIADATLLQQYVTGQDVDEEFDQACADLTDSGSVTTADLIELLNMLVDDG